MKICSPQLGLAPRSVLGGEVFDREVLLGLARKGVDVEVILPRSLPHDHNIKNLNFTYLPVSHFPAVLFNLFLLPYLYKAIKKDKIHIIRLHQPQFTGLVSILIKLINPKIKIVATYHQYKESNFSVMSNIINKYWDHIICDSEAVANQVAKNYKVSKDKITVVHNGAPSYLKPQPKDKGLVKKFRLEDKIVLLYQGFFIERKNPLFLLDVIKQISIKNPNVRLIYWGKGPLEEAIKDKARELGILGKIIIQKPFFGKDKNKIHNLADIFVHPSLDEGFALAPLEAMACAKPIVISNGYSAREAVEDGANGFLCSLKDISSWTEKITTLVNDNSLRVKMGKASLVKVKREFRWNITVKKHLEVFRRLDR